MNTDVLMFVLFAASVAGQLSDIYTTEKGLASGKDKEENGLVARVIKKIGYTGLALVKGLGIGTVLPISLFAFAGKPYGIFAALASAGIGFYAGVKNYLLLRKQGIKIF